MGHGPTSRHSISVRFDDVFRSPARARQPRIATCSHLMDFGWVFYTVFTGFPGALDPDPVVPADVAS
eukprot:10457880-Lingulodinium_polyedra.AAC.1